MSDQCRATIGPSDVVKRRACDWNRTWPFVFTRHGVRFRLAVGVDQEGPSLLMQAHCVRTLRCGPWHTVDIVASHRARKDGGTTLEIAAAVDLLSRDD